MHPHVTVEIPGLREPEQTQVTLVGLLAGVDAKVLGQRGGVGEGLPTESASVWAVPGVGS